MKGHFVHLEKKLSVESSCDSSVSRASSSSIIASVFPLVLVSQRPDLRWNVFHEKLCESFERSHNGLLILMLGIQPGESAGIDVEEYVAVVYLALLSNLHTWCRLNLVTTVWVNKWLQHDFGWVIRNSGRVDWVD